MKHSLLAISILAATASDPAFAHQAGDIIARAGVVTVTTGENTSGVQTNAAALGHAGNIGGKATLNNDTQLGLNFAYMATNNIAIELLAATPFEHDVAIKGTSAVDGKLGSVKHLPPTLSAIFYPMDSNSAFQPYMGVGINYTWFFDEKVSSAAKAGDNAAGFNMSNLKVKNSWGWAAQIGADYMLTDKLMLNAQVRYIDIDTEATVDVANSTVKAKVDVDIKPIVYMLGLGYKF